MRGIDLLRVFWRLLWEAAVSGLAAGVLLGGLVLLAV